MVDLYGAKGMTVLLVDFDPLARRRMSTQLHEVGFRTIDVGTAAEARRSFIEHDVDVVLLDVNLPEANGFALAAEFRNRSDVGVIVLTSRSEENDRLIGLELGVDDYLIKPANPKEVLLKLRNLGLRVQAMRNSAPSCHGKLSFCGWVMDLDAHTLASPEGEAIRMTKGEFKMLQVLVENAGRVLSREQILELTQANDNVSFDRAVDSMIRRLRRKMEPNPRQPELLTTVQGIGYMFSAKVEKVTG